MSEKNYVYFFTDGTAIKIGKSKDIPHRKNRLQTGNPRQLRLIGRVEGSYTEETLFHNKFEPFRIYHIDPETGKKRRTEWFNLTEAQVLEHLKRKKIIDKFTKKWQSKPAPANYKRPVLDKTPKKFGYLDEVPCGEIKRNLVEQLGELFPAPIDFRQSQFYDEKYGGFYGHEPLFIPKGTALGRTECKMIFYTKDGKKTYVEPEAGWRRTVSMMRYAGWDQHQAHLEILLQASLIDAEKDLRSLPQPLRDLQVWLQTRLAIRINPDYPSPYFGYINGGSGRAKWCLPLVDVGFTKGETKADIIYNAFVKCIEELSEHIVLLSPGYAPKSTPPIACGTTI